MLSLENERKEIDAIDGELLPLLEKRMRVCEKIALKKQEAGLRITDERREAAVLKKVSEASPKELKTSISGAFDGIMTMSKWHELALISEDAPLTKQIGAMLSDHCRSFANTVGILSEKVLEKAKNRYPESKLSLFSNPDTLWDGLLSDDFDAVILPDRNEKQIPAEFFRSVSENGLFFDASFRISAHYCLFGGLGIRRVSEVYGSEEALAYCSEFIRKYDLKAIPYTQPTALKMAAASGRREIAVIAEAGSEFGLPLNILSDNIANADAPEQHFYALTKQVKPTADADRIALSFRIDDRAGKLAHVLSWFAALSVNLTRLETCPDHRREIFVFLECEGKPDDSKMTTLLGVLSAELKDFHFLGAYVGA